MKYKIHSLYGTAAAADLETARGIHAAIRGYILENPEPEPESYLIDCPACRASQDKMIAYIGMLGTRSHFSCRYCGIGFSRAESGR